MTRAYEMKRRAEQMEDTRRRIVEAAVELHATLGPAHTSVSAIAERAGVQRQTYYRHFPEQRSLLRACSGLYMGRNPLPDAESWRAIPTEERLRHGLEELYAYYADNEPMLSRVIRDAESDQLTREIVDTLMTPFMDGLRDALAEALESEPGSPVPTAALDVALDFNTWRILARRHRLSSEEAATLAARLLRCG